MENESELQDLLESMRNNIEISLLLLHMGKDKLLPTPLEQILIQAQDVVDGWCVVEDSIVN